MTKYLFLGPPPDNRSLVIACLTGATAHDAREYAVRHFNAEIYRTGKGQPVSPQSLFVHETGEDATEDVRLQQVGSAAGAPNTLRLQVQRRVARGKDEWTEWEDA